MSTDRPDQTESPYTVDAGHFQLETDIATYTQDRDSRAGGDVRTREWSVAALNLKLGLSNRVDVQFMVDTHVGLRTEDRVARTVDRASGFGDLTTRLKLNFWGNDAGRTAFGVMPFIKWPLAKSGVRNGKTEGGVIFPLAVELSGGWGMGAMTEIDFVDDGDGGRDTDFVNSITFGRELTTRLGAYVELFAVVPGASGAKWVGQFDIGFTYALSENARFDFGCNFGVTKSAPDFNPFVGFSMRR